MNEKILYKKDSKEKIRIWKVYINNDELIQESGLLNGKLVKNSKICTPKNVGKSNMTTGNQQAALERDSEYKQKLDEGYFPTQKEAESEEVIHPMLAKSYGDEKKKVDWKNAYGQPKLDGMRSLWHIYRKSIIAVSRDGKEINGLEHIRTDLGVIHENVILDGELYAHGLNFQENMRLIKKYRPGETEKIKFHVYDMVSKEPFAVRFQMASSLIQGLSECELVKTKILTSEEDLKSFHSQNIADGFEGSILRWGNEGYKANGRSSNLLKYKDFLDIAAKIVDVLPADQRPSWGVPVLEYRGKTFQAGMKFSHAEREEWLKNKKNYIGKTAEIRFFEYSEDGIPRFPVCVGIRLDC